GGRGGRGGGGLFGGLGSLGGRGRGSGGGLAGGVDAGQHFARGDGAAVALDDFSQHARSRGRHFQHDLVGLDFDQDFVRFDGCARLLLPGQQGRFGNGFGELGNDDVGDSHFVYSVRCLFWTARRGQSSKRSSWNLPRAARASGWVTWS